MSEDAAALKWGVERRLEFIEFRLFWEGGVNRSDIIEMFGVSVPQASKDLTLYQERAPGTLSMTRAPSGMLLAPGFRRYFSSLIQMAICPDFGHWRRDWLMVVRTGSRTPLKWTSRRRRVAWSMSKP